MSEYKQIGRDNSGRPINVRAYISKATARKWIAEGKAALSTYTRIDGRAFGALTVYASADKPGHTCHFRDPDQDGSVAVALSDAMRALRAIPSEARAAASRENGKRPPKPGSRPRGRPRKEKQE